MYTIIWTSPFIKQLCDNILPEIISFSNFQQKHFKCIILAQTFIYFFQVHMHVIVFESSVTKYYLNSEGGSTH